MSNENRKILGYLKKTRLLNHLSDHILHQLVPLSKLVSYPAHTEVLREGQANVTVFFLIKGVVSVYSGGELISKMHRQGDIFGEISVIRSKPCIATVITETPVEVFCLQARDIGDYRDLKAEALQNTLYRVFAMILTDKLDITTQKAKKFERANTQLQESHEELQKTHAQLVQSAKLASLGEVATGVAHEINQPLSYIKTVLQTLKEDFKLEDVSPKDAMVFLTESLRQIGRITEIIQHLRTFGRAEETRFVEVNLEKIWDNILLLMGERMRVKDIRLVRQIDETLPLIKGSSNQLEQVLINLCQNSLDELMKQERERCITIKMTSSVEHGIVVITFSDNGSGIPAKDLNKIFDPFYTTKPVGKGTGLGLSIIYGIIESHGGKIICQSQTNQGTSFIITLPIEGESYGKTKDSGC